MATQTPRFCVDLAQSSADIFAVQQLRYTVFCTEMGAAGAGIDHAEKREFDRFDDFADHLILRDLTLPETAQIVGVYRVLRADHAAQAGGFYSATEYDLTPLVRTGGQLLELSRSCVLPAYRGGTALLHLWRALAAYVNRHNIDYLFGVASFSGVDLTKHQHALTLLGQAHLAPEALRTIALDPGAVPLEQVAGPLDRRAAMVAMPALIKAYLRMGGVVGDGAFVDQDFKTVDVCMILDTAKLSARHRALLGAD